MKTILKIFFCIQITFFSSCEQPKNTDSRLTEIPTYQPNLPTFDSNFVSNISFIDNTNYFSNRGLKIIEPDRPTCLKKFDSLYIYLPDKQFHNCCLMFQYDSISVYNSIQPDFEICDLHQSCVITMTSKYFEKYDTLVGVIRCWDSIKKSIDYYPFILPLD